MNGRRLYRSRQDRILGGVAGGLADYLGLDPALIRIAWAVLVLASAGSLFLLYIVMWIVVPEAPPGFGYGAASGAPPSAPTEGAPTEGAPSDGQPSPTGETSASSAPPPSIGHEWARHQTGRRSDWSGQGGLILGALLILAGAWFLARDYVPVVRDLDLWPTILIIVGVLLLVTALRPRSR